MRIAYVDTSCLVAVAFADEGAANMAARLEAHDRLYSDNLLEAELRSALAREGVEQNEDHLLTRITWMYPGEPLSEEYRRILKVANVRGADLRHLACALYLERHAGPIEFLTLDDRQRQAAASLGLKTGR